MRGIFLFLWALSLGVTCSGQESSPQPQQGRDLIYAKEPATKTTPPAAPTIPHSYALVVGIAHYTNLPSRAQLQFADRDAEEIYTTLISAQGGNFPAENVHKLINE